MGLHERRERSEIRRTEGGRRREADVAGDRCTEVNAETR